MVRKILLELQGRYIGLGPELGWDQSKIFVVPEHKIEENLIHRREFHVILHIFYKAGTSNGVSVKLDDGVREEF